MAKEAKKARVEGRRFRISFILLSAAYILLGLMRLVYQNPESFAICYLLGGLALVGGLIRLAFYFTRRRVRHIFRNDLAIGVILLAAGIYCFFKPIIVLELLPTLLGFAILFDSVLKMEYALDSRRLGSRLWAVLMLLSLVSALCSILLVSGSFAGTVLFYFLGGVLVYDGLINLFALAVLMAALRGFGKKPAAVQVKNSGDKAQNTTVNNALEALTNKDGNPEGGLVKNLLEDSGGLPPGADTDIQKPVRGPASPTMEEEAQNKSGPRL